MKSLEVKRTAKRDAEGRLYSVGVEWGEQDAMLSWLLIRLFVLAVGLIFTGLLFCWTSFGMTMLLFGVVGLPVSFALLRFFPESPRSMAFDLDGRMLAPDGLPDWPSQMSIGGDHASIVSFEARRQPKSSADQDSPERFAVVMITSGGDMIFLSRNATEQTALKASVQLTHALDQLRLQMATGSDRIQGGRRLDDNEPWAVIS